MTSLYNRATPSQDRILRIVEGAVLNTADAHGNTRDVWLARSIAKRAAGTLSAQWPEVLAANSRLPASGSVADTTKCRACERRAHLARLRVRRQRISTLGGAAERRASQLLRRPPLRELWNRLKREMWQITRADDSAKAAAHVHLLRMIDKLQREIEAAKIDGSDGQAASGSTKSRDGKS